MGRRGRGTSTPPSSRSGLPAGSAGKALAADDPFVTTDYATQAEFDPFKNAALRQWFDPVRDHGAVGNASLDGTTGTDDSAAIQASIDDANAAGGGTVPIYKRHRANELVIKSNVTLICMHKGARLQAPPGQSATQAVLRMSEPSSMPAGGWYQGDAYHIQLLYPFIDGNARNGAAGDWIRLISGNGDAQTTPTGLWNTDYWSNVMPIIDGAFVFDAGRHGITLGRNQRGARVTNSSVSRSRQRGWWLKNTDSEFSLLEASECGEGFYLDTTFQSNRMVGSKSWWNYTTAAGPSDGTAWSGTGNGFLFNGAAASAAGNVLSGCESQDNFGFGAKLDGVRSNVLRGFKAGGDTLGGVGLFSTSQNCEYNDIDVHLQWADRVLSPVAVVLDGANTKNNQLRISDDPAQAYSGTVTPISAQNGALLYLNRYGGPAFERWHVVGAAGEPAFENSWADSGTVSNNRTVAFRLDGSRLEIRGNLRGGAIATVMFTLPAWARPGTNTISLAVRARDVSQAKDFMGLLSIANTGTVTLLRWDSTEAWVASTADATGDRVWMDCGFAL
jgi:hypothetical protein